MGRPRKDSQTVDAKQRLIDSFWTLLEQNKLHQITVGMIAQDAKCNRGTFYYHYADMNDLVLRAAEHEFVSSNGTLKKLFGLMTGEDAQPGLAETKDCIHIQRIALLVDQGGFDITFRSMRDFVLRLWTFILCPDGKQLKPEARVILEYTVCGLFGMFVSNLHSDQTGGIPATDSMERFAVENSQFLFAQICRAQGAPLSKASARLRMTDEIIKAMEDEASAKR